VLDGREYVLPEDVKDCAVAALAHRLTLRAETWSSGVTAVQVVTELLGQVAGPATTRPEPA
jgi:MoxR-like ATPase